MSKGWKIVSVGIIAILAIVVLVWGAWNWFSRQALPKTSGTLKVAGPKQPVEIVRDEFGVPHIYAHTPEDLYFALGFTHAQERFWQMEFQRRVTYGRLSEIFGEATLETDRYLRQFNFRASTEGAYALLDPETERIVDAYAAGVQAYIQDRPPAELGLEFALLGLQGVDLEIEDWTPVDSLAWGEMMVFDQSDKMRSELTNISELAAVGESLYADLHPAYRSDRPTIIQGEDQARDDQPVAEQEAPRYSQSELDYLLSLVEEGGIAGLNPDELAAFGFGQAGGSNSFTVAGPKSETGKPVLVNDPHMAVATPALWYQVGLHCVEKSPACLYDLRGFSLPGLPVILIGHNDRIAWGLTNANFDAEDVFIERINPENPNQYEVNGKWIDMELRREEIGVRGQEPVVIYVRSTRNGVVGSDVITDQQPFSYGTTGPQPYVLTYAWTGLQPMRSLQAVIMANRAQNWTEFVSALEVFDVGKQNWLYADVDGNIGYVLPGKLPIRGKGDGSLPVPGWNDEYRWKGFIPYDDLPRVLNPKAGFIVAANNPQVRNTRSPILLGTEYDRGQRADRITDLIQADGDKLSLAELQAIQTDNQTVAENEYITYLKDLAFTDPSVAAARDSLLEWDGQMGMDSPQAVMYAIFWKTLLAEIFHDQLPEKVWPNGDTRWEDVVYFLMQEPDNDWWDQLATPDIKERRDAILKTAFEKAFNEGVEMHGENLEDWQWGQLHTIYFENATLGKSGISLIENLFNRGPFPVHGSTTVIQKTCWSVKDPYAVTCIPALRQVVDLGDLSRSQMIHSLGQSGHPLSPHYDDFIDMWRNFQYIPSNWLRSEAEAGRSDTLTLQPK